MFKFYHNPRCSKSRAALAILTEAGVQVELIEYLKTPPDAHELAAIVALLGGDARVLMRRGEAIYKTLKLGEETKQAALMAAMVAHPILIERPLVFDETRAIICRPPELVAAFL